MKTQASDIFDALVSAIRYERSFAFERRFGEYLGSEWKEFPLHDTMKMLVSQLTGRFTVGEALSKIQKESLIGPHIYNKQVATKHVSDAKPNSARHGRGTPGS
jgi:hypothetical protein